MLCSRRRPFFYHLDIDSAVLFSMRNFVLRNTGLVIAMIEATIYILLAASQAV
jgi:hypothetical protein